ncbi:MAG: SIS domain-containing protein [Elusimicrobia bacterium]|nr:SIS domain-containing protein [Elusimicrobiota bacterium]
MKNTIVSLIQESIDAKKKMLDEGQLVYIQSIANKINEAYQHGKKTIIFGNGGSACDALHFAAELVCIFEKNRKALPSISLTENISSLTAIGNDFGYEYVFSRQVEAFANKGDIIIAITTSGNSENVIKAVEKAKEMGLFVIGLTGEDGGQLKLLSDMCYRAPSKITGRIQECHILVLHILAKLVEEKIFAE